MVPATAIVRDGATARVYVQRTPERFELREIQTRRTVGGNVEVIAGLRDGERIVVRGADKMPRQ
jgi:cobalt-zinc-cadmium efflux system membrane fusion protein